MSDQQDDKPASRPSPSFSMQNTPNAERYVLEADAMRRRQMRTGLLHGSRRTWREHQRVWPAVVVGVIVVAVILAGLAVADAIGQQRKKQRAEEREQKRSATSAPATPGPTASGSPSVSPSPT